jgi:hypothetical protein
MKKLENVMFPSFFYFAQYRKNTLKYIKIYGVIYK